MRRSTRTEEDWLLGRTSDTSSGEFAQRLGYRKLQQHGRNPARKWLGYSTLNEVDTGVRSSEEPAATLIILNDPDAEAGVTLSQILRISRLAARSVPLGIGKIVPRPFGRPDKPHSPA